MINVKPYMYGGKDHAMQLKIFTICNDSGEVVMLSAIYQDYGWRFIV